MIDRKKLKADARLAMREARPHPIWVTLAIAVILAVLTGLSMYISGYFETLAELLRQAASGELVESIMAGEETAIASEGASGFGAFLVMAMEMMMAVLSLGYTLYCLRISRHVKASVGDVFDAFGYFLRAVVLRVMKSLVLLMIGLVFALALSFLLTAVIIVSILVLYNAPEETPEMLLAVMNAPWFLPLSAALTYIPIIAASYFYRLAEFFMLDNPGMSAIQSLSMSRMAMRGRKWQLFKLDLSFLGWVILSAVPFVALWVQPYITVTMANLYNEAAPQFLKEMEEKLRARQEAMQKSPDYRGYHVPGQNRDDDEN